jgi:hypothetical protein
MKSPRDAKLQAFGLAGAAAALLLTALLAGCGGGGEPAASASPTTVFGRQARELALGIAAVRSGATVSVATTVLGQDGAGAKDLDVAVAADGGAWVGSKGCGSGRYCGDVDVAGPQPSLRVRVTRPTGGVSTVAVTLPRDPRAARAARLVRAAATAIRRLHSLIIDEHLSSGPPYEPLVTQFSYVAPDRLAYSTSRAGDAVVVGGRRWDRRTGKQRWLASPQDPLALPAPDWRRALDASILGSGRRAGRPVWRVSFYDPTVPAWFEVELDKRTSLPLHLRMTAAAHFMTHTFHAFNAPLSIMPPV